MSRIERRSSAFAAKQCLACRELVWARPYFRVDAGWFCGGCLSQYSIRELQTVVGCSELHGQLYC